MNTALAKQEPMAFEPRNVDEAYGLCTKLVASGFLPRTIKTPEQALAIFVAGRELGLSPMAAFRSIHVVEGRVTMEANLMVALLRGSGKCEYFKEVEETEGHVVYECKRTDENCTHKMLFSMADAQKAGLTGKDNWKKYPKNMMRARCKANLAREAFGDVLSGVYTPDELEKDIPVAVESDVKIVESVPKQIESVSEKQEPKQESKLIEQVKRNLDSCSTKEEQDIAISMIGEMLVPEMSDKEKAEARSLVISARNKFKKSKVEELKEKLIKQGDFNGQL